MALERFVRVLEIAAGAFVTGYLDSQFVAPVAESALPALQVNHTLFKATDAATTAGVGWVTGKVGDLIHARVGRALEDGGYFLAAMKAIATVIPGVDVQVSTPNFLGFLRSAGAPPQVIAQAAQQQQNGQAQLPAGTAQATKQAQQAQPNVPANYYFPVYGGALNADLNVGA